MTDSSYDLTLLGLAKRALSYTGHIEDMGDDERVFLLGAFAGAVLRLEQQVRELWDENESDRTDKVLHQVMLALGASADWAGPLDEEKT